MDPPQIRGGTMAQDRSGPAREHRGHPAPVSGDRSVADGVHTAMERVKEPSQPVRDHVAADSELEQLPPSHHPVLAPSERADRRIRRGRVTFDCHRQFNVTRGRHAGRFAPRV
jgi:hypothetical protein